MKKFKGLFWTQFLGAANDNFFKNVLVMLITFKGIQVWGLDAKSVVALAGGVFILPYFLFSGIAGEICDHFERAKVMRATKYAELLIMAIASLCFYLESYDSLLIVLFFMGAQSTFFSPAKYSSIIELCEEKDFVKANAFIEMGTFAAILIGTIAGGMAASSQSYTLISACILLMACVGIFSSQKIPNLPVYPQSKKFSWNPVRPSSAVLKLAWRNKDIRNTTLLTSLFWFIGACLLTIIPIFTRDILHGDESLATLILACFTLGIGIGSFACEKLSKGKVELAISGGAFFFVLLFLFDLSFLQYSQLAPLSPYTALSFLQTEASFRILLNFILLSMSLGMFAVPINTWLQWISPNEERSRIIAANNIINSIAMVFSAAFLILLNQVSWDGPKNFLGLAIFSLACFAIIAFLFPVIISRTWSFVSRKGLTDS